MTLTEYLDQNGNYLMDSLGAFAWALDSIGTIKLLSILHKLKIPVLGGDILIKINNEYSYTGDSWSLNKVAGESNEEFNDKIFQKTLATINRYEQRNPGLYGYVLVPDLESDEFDKVEIPPSVLELSDT